MKRIMKKLSALLLVLTMSIGMMPVSASAATMSIAHLKSYSFPIDSETMSVPITLDNDYFDGLVVTVYNHNNVAVINTKLAMGQTLDVGNMYKGWQYTSLRYNGGTEYSGYASIRLALQASGAVQVIRDITQADFSFSNLNQTYDGNAKNPGMAAIDGAGTVTLYYGESHATSATNAGSYKIYAKVSGGDMINPCTSFFDTGKTLNIAKANVSADMFSVTAPDDLTYDGTEKEYDTEIKSDSKYNGVSSSRFYEGVNGTSYGESAIAPVNTGDYKLYLNVSGGNNYNDNDKLEVKAFTIRQRPFSLVLPVDEEQNTYLEGKVYDRTAAYVMTAADLANTTPGENDIIAADKEAFSITAVEGTYDQANAGARIVTLNSVTCNNNNYKWQGNQSAASEITPRSLKDATVTFTLTPDNFTYNGEVQGPQFIVTDTSSGSKVTLERYQEYTISGKSTQKEIDQYSASVTGTGNYKDKVVKTWEIKKKLNTVTIGNTAWVALSKIYDGVAVADPDFISDNKSEIVSEGKQAIFTYFKKNNGDYEQLDAAPVNAGSYAVSVAVPETEHYYAAVSDKYDFTIGPKTVTIVQADPDEALVYNGQVQMPALAVTKTVAGEALTVTATAYQNSAVKESKNAGEYTAKAFVLADTETGLAANYEVSEQQQTEGIDFEIAKKPAELIWTGNAYYTYNTQAQGYTAVVDPESLVTGETLDITVIYKKNGTALAGMPKDAGKYTASVAIAEDCNYAFAGSHTAEKAYTIAPKNLNDTDIAVKNFEFDRENKVEHPATILYLCGQTPTELVLDTDYTQFGDISCSEPDEYTFTATGIGNYTGERTFDWTITALPEVTIDNDISKEYDGTAAAAPAYTIDPEEAWNVKVEYKKASEEDSAYTTTAPVNAGDYKVKVTAAGVRGYADTTAEKAFSITAKTVKVSGITAEDKVYDGNEKAKLAVTNAEFEGMAASDNGKLTVASVEGTFADANVGQSKAVTISNIVLGGEAAANYTLSNENQTETTAAITPAEIKNIVVTGYTGTYDGTDHQAVADATAETVAEQALTWEYRKTAEDAWASFTVKDAADSSETYQYKVSAPNHADAEGTFVVAIAKADPKLQVTENIEKTYGDAAFVPAAQTESDGAITYKSADENVVKADAANAVSIVNAGEAKITVSVAEAANYLADQKEVAVKVAKKEITVSGITAAYKFFDGQKNAVLDTTNAKFAGVVGSDRLTVAATGAFADAKPGTKKEVAISGLTLGGPKAANYKLAAKGQQTKTSGTIKTVKVIAKAKGAGHKKVTLSWEPIQGATKYVVYGAKCGKKAKKLATTTKNTVDVKKIAGKKLKDDKSYAFKVEAYYGSTKLSSSVSVHVYTEGYHGKYGNVTKLTPAAKAITLASGKTATVKAKATIFKNKKQMPKGHAAAFRYYSSDSAVAKVSKDGVVTAVKAGTAKIYIMAVNGEYGVTTVTVK